MTATLRITRQPVGIELRHRQFDIRLDGSDVGAVQRKETLDAPVQPGRHTVEVRAGRYTTGPLPFEADDGQTVAFRCHGAALWPRYFTQMLKRDEAIALKRS